MREAALLSVLRAMDGRAHPPADLEPDPITCRRLPALGAGLALQLCLESTGEAAGDATDLAAWAEAFLTDCADVAAAELVLAHGESGFMRLAADDTDGIDAWIATTQAPASWRERADIDWWAGWLARRWMHELDALRVQRDAYQRQARVHLEMMGYQVPYPADAVLGGIAVEIWRDVVRALIGVALDVRDRGDAVAVLTERTLVALLECATHLETATVATALSVLSLDRENAGWHAAVPGVALPSLVRLDADSLALSVHGVLSEPLFFLSRELRRRDAEAYHNAAVAREEAFRRDLAAQFGDRRFVVADRRIILRWQDGSARTDIDAAVFDRKTGALAVFELKSQDPFARSTTELVRQRDNLLVASRQVAGVLDWVNRHGADEILRRMDRQASKRFRVRKVYPFVLGRYLAHFPDGPVPNQRAAWGTWPQVLRLLDQHPIGAKDGNPIASLFMRLQRDIGPIDVPTDLPSRRIRLGDTRVTVWPSFAAYREANP